jgi:hypothetical protein
MVTYLPRSAWGARASRGGVALDPSVVEGEALHWPGMAKPIDATGDIGMRRIASALRGWQNYHMDGRGWSDIAYQIAIDQAGRAWTLRGLNIRSGANGDADVNRRFGAFLLVLAPGEKPTAAMIATTKGVILDFRKRFPKARLKPYGHKDVRPAGTDCPGPIAYAAINAGTFTPSITVGGTAAAPTGGTTMAIQDTTEYKAAFQANVDYNRLLWGEGGSAGEFQQRTDARILDILNNKIPDIIARLERIEDDTDDGTPVPA